jgi:excisionase family DNA binding protein
VESEYIPLTEAAKEVGLSRAKLWRMVKDGRLPSYEDPRDGRVTLVRRDELQAAMRPIPRRVIPRDMGKGVAAA